MKLKNGSKGAWIALLAAVLDQATKSIVRNDARSNLLISAVQIWEWPGVVAIRRATQNTGVAFSMFSGGGLAVSVATALLIAGLIAWLLVKDDQPRGMRTGLWMMVGGGMGNLYDRIVYGSVTDFIEPLFVRFAVFNLADVLICVGAAVAFLFAFLDERKKEKDHERDH